MCGNAELILRDRPRAVDIFALRSMARSVAHRGPDDEELDRSDELFSVLLFDSWYRVYHR